MSQLGFVLELSPTDKVPGAYLSVIFGVGFSSFTLDERVLLVVGLKSSAGAMALDGAGDTGIVDILNESDADLQAGEGSELATMLYGALRIGGIKVKAAAPTISGATAATATITIDGTWTTPGAWRYRLAGIELTQGITATDTPATLSAAIAAYINARGHLPVTAAAAAGAGTTYIVTLTNKCAGIRGNQLMIWQDISQLPAGATSAIAGGSAVGNGAKRFHNGAGTEDVAALITALSSERYYRIALAQQDATNLAKWVVFIDSQAGPIVGFSQHAIVANSGTLSATTSLAQVTLNDQRFEMLWMKDGETYPGVIAATFAANRAALEIQNPNQTYDGYVLPGVFGQTDKATVPDRPTQVAALDVGITPITTIGAKARIVRAVTTRSLTDSGAVDDGTIDVADSAVVDDARDVVKTFWVTDYSVKNKFVTDDTDPNAARTADSGIATPKVWAAEVTTIFKRLEELLWLTKVDSNPVSATLNRTASSPRIAFYAPVIRLPHQHQLEGVLAQTKFAAAT